MSYIKGFSQFRKVFFQSRVFVFILTGVGCMFFTFLTHDNSMELGISGIASIFIGIGVNNFTAIEKFFARIAGATETSKGILITRDFNTIPEENYKEKFTAEKIKSFIEKSEEEFKLSDIKSILW